MAEGEGGIDQGVTSKPTARASSPVFIPGIPSNPDAAQFKLTSWQEREQQRTERNRERNREHERAIWERVVGKIFDRDDPDYEDNKHLRDYLNRKMDDEISR